MDKKLLMDMQIDTIHRYVSQTLGQSGSHGMDHTDRVVDLCRSIGLKEDADMRILLPAALLHDVGRPLEKEQGLPHEREGARMAAEFLHSIGYDSTLIPAISSAIRTHRFQSEETPKTLEAWILSDADKLDAMGAMGIARTFLRAGEHGGGIDDAVAHFHDKLLKLRDLMHTRTGRELAAKRHEFLVAFLSTLETEMTPPAQ